MNKEEKILHCYGGRNTLIYCPECSDKLTRRSWYTGKFDDQTGRPVVYTELYCPNALFGWMIFSHYIMRFEKVAMKYSTDMTNLKDYIERREKKLDEILPLEALAVPGKNLLKADIKSFLTESITQASEIAVNEYRERLGRETGNIRIGGPYGEYSAGFNDGILEVLKLIKEK